MKALFAGVAMLGGLIGATAGEPASRLSWPNETVDTWQGFKRHHFTVDGCQAWVVEPKEARPGQPWSWCMEFPDAFTDRCAAPALLAAGFHHAHIVVGNTFGCPDAVKHFNAFYDSLRTRGLAQKATLIGISRGGLYAYRWASENPEKVAVIYGDAPVCDFKSWPGGKGQGKGSAGDWAALLKCYQFKDEAEALAYRGNPVDVLETLAKAKIALIHVVGDADDVVPAAENTAIVEERYRKLGGEIQVIHKPGIGHHPHGLADPTPVVKFVLTHTGGKADAQVRLEPDAFQQIQRLGRGVNIIGWDRLWQDRARGNFKDLHFQRIREAGFNHVRINLHPLRDGKPDAQGKLRQQFWDTLDWAIDGALTNHLLAILDYHDDLAISPDPEGQKKDFLASWAAIAEHCKDRPSEVLFEILNEPAPKFTHASWSNYWHEALALIRKTNPSRAVLIGPDPWNSFKQLDSLQLPENDRNLIATVHYYDPFPFTHQGTPWTGQRDKTGVTWEGTEKERLTVEQDFARVQAWAKQHQRPIYLGEFGAYEKGEMASRVRWTTFVARQAEALGWSWGYWQFTGDFIVFDMGSQSWVEPIRQALAPGKP